ncbi:DUF2786 domain-containing protein [Streptomyces sp. NPDC006879]|uniref:DUF2786 domain-containing protein n=1 Tax=Streptomyces sp. NPDC006879 TaxID=3364767 RepID=UPI00369E16E9
MDTHSEADAAAARVERAFAAALYSEDDSSLDSGASLLAAEAGAWSAVGGEVLGRGRSWVRRAWERGWQPADLARLVRRDLGGASGPAGRHVRLLADLVAAEVRSYDRLPPRWQGQLAELGADREVWWGEDARYAAAIARRESADRFTLATALLEVLRLLVRLPSIEPAGPLPETGQLHMPLHVHGEPRMLTRIRALLVKAEATSYPPEAEALSAKAQELMARHTIDEALLVARGERSGQEVPGACRIGVEAPYETAKAVLLDAVASANHCRAVWNSTFEFSTVVGFESDLDAVELLHTSLLVQGAAAMTRAEAEQRAGGRKRTKTFRQSFLLAYASRLGERLSSVSERTAREADAGGAGGPGGQLLPVLMARDLAVTARAEEMFPQTTTTRLRGATDRAGWTDGTAAADRANMATGRRRIG